VNRLPILFDADGLVQRDASPSTNVFENLRDLAPALRRDVKRDVLAERLFGRIAVYLFRAFIVPAR
jgi:hypothetical protein